MVVALTLELTFLDILGDNVVVQLCRDHWLEGLSMGDESFHYILINRLMIVLRDTWRSQVLVNTGDVSCKRKILFSVLRIEEQENKVETR
jgi:hypothetical protein